MDYTPHMSDSGPEERSARLTIRGTATRDRIVSVATELMYVQGVAGTSLDDVMRASGTGKSQIYHYFSDKNALIEEVVAEQVARVLRLQKSLLRHADSMHGLEQWRDAIVRLNVARQGAYGCPLGSLVSELSEHSECARSTLASGYATWDSYLADCFQRMQVRGELAAEVDVGGLAVSVLAALQGGLLLAQVTGDPSRLQTALDMALSHVRKNCVELG